MGLASSSARTAIFYFIPSLAVDNAMIKTKASVDFIL
jgi:hypothetical protein